MKRFITGFLTATCLSAAVALSVYFSVQKVALPEKVKTTQISGEKIDHSDFKYTGKTVTFTTQAEGKGEITTEIPKTNIPEAKAWMQNNNALMLEFQLEDRRIYGLSYMRRWNNISVGGGVLVSESKFEGVKGQVQYWFGL